MSLKVLFVVLLALLAARLAGAQRRVPVPRWTRARVDVSNSPRTYPWPHAMVIDEAGNVFTAGMFNDTVTFGRYSLHSAGQGDFYVAKYVPATGTWAWAVRGGGRESDVAYGLALRQGCVYVTGYLVNNRRNDNGVTLESTQPVPQPGAVDATPSSDLFVAKYVDGGTCAVLAWCQVAGGAEMDYGTAVAVNGPSVYVTGTLSNDRSHRQGAVFGTSGLLPGLWPLPAWAQRPGQWPQAGTAPALGNDLVLAKYTDHGLGATFDWSQVAGGHYGAVGRALAVAGRNVYVAGTLGNDDRAAAAYVFLGGHGRVRGTARPLGAGRRWGQSWLLVKYTDQGDHAAVGWSQVAGCDGAGSANQVAVSGRNVYVLGAMGSARARSLRLYLGDGRVAAVADPAGRRPRPAVAAVLAKYIDQGPTSHCAWLRLDGAAEYYYEGTCLLARGPWVYTLGQSFFNRTRTRQSVRGGTRCRPAAGHRGEAPYDVKGRPYIAGYYDAGPRVALRWVRVFDYPFQMGPGMERYFFLGLSGPCLYVVGNTWLPAPFGRFTLVSPGHNFGFVVAGLDLSPTLPGLGKRERPAGR